MAFDNILVATDFSEQADVAIAQAAGVATRCGASRVTLLHVTAEGSAPPPGAAISSATIEDVHALRRTLHEEARTQLDVLAERLRGQGLEVAVELRAGHPDEVIAEAGAELGSDLIVTGTHGRTGLARFLLGSVAERVVRTSQTNVLVARAPRADAGAFRRILVPTDFSPASEKALRMALALASPGAEVELFHAWQYPVGTHGLGDPNTIGPLTAVRDEIVAAAERMGKDWVRRAAPPEQVTVRFVHDHGPPAIIVGERLEATAYDLVAMGTHGYRGFRRFMLGSVAEATVRHAPCSVLVAHAGAQ
jgi:nucleotide-binding universal stress UspA family protein